MGKTSLQTSFAAGDLEETLVQTSFAASEWGKHCCKLRSPQANLKKHLCKARSPEANEEITRASPVRRFFVSKYALPACIFRCFFIFAKIQFF
jgi:hypothetical protein